MAGLHLIAKEGHKMEIQTAWIFCPICGNKTRNKMMDNTELKNFPLYCPKCKKETIINVKNMNVTFANDK